MAIHASQSTVVHGLPGLPALYAEPHWFAAYTSANHEKRVSQQLTVRAVEHFLPVYSSVRRWKDRRVILEMPLFPGYVFVRLAFCDRLRVLQVPGVARLVGFDGAPAVILDSEIESLRGGLAAGARVTPHPYLRAGRRVEVKSGPMAGTQGILLKRKRGARLIVSIELIQRSVAVEVDESAVEPVL